MAYAGFLRTLPAPATTLGGFVCLLDTTWFTQADSNALDGTTFINGGGSLRLYTDATKTTQLPVDVVSFVTGGTPEVKVFTRLPSYASGETIWIESDATATSQPVSTSTYGSEAVWQDYDMFTLDGVTDRSGNKTFTSTDMSTAISDSPIGGNVADFNGTSSWFEHTQTGTSTDTSPFTIKAWIKPVSATNQAGIAVSDGSYLSNYGYGLRTDGKIRGEIYYSGANRNVGSTNTRTANAWNYTAYTYESDTQHNVYLNGVYSTDTYSNRHFRRDLDLRWGKRANYSSSGIRGWFDGEMSAMGVLKSNNELLQDDFDSEYANQNSPSTFGSSSDWTTGGGGGGENILSDDSSQTVSISEPTLTQDFILTIQELQSFSTLSNVVLLSGQEVSVNSLSQSNQLDESNISQNHNVPVNDLSSRSSITEPSISQDYNMSVNDLSSSSSITEPSILQSAALLVDSLICSSSLDEVNLAVSSTLLLEDLRSQSALDGANLSQANVLSVESLGSSISLEQASLTLAGVLASSSLTSSVKLGSIGLTQDSSLVIDSITSASLLGNAVVQEASQLILDNLSSGTILGNVSISAGDVLSVQSIESINKLDNLDLIQETFLLVDSVSSSQSLGYVFFGVTPELEAYTITFSQSSDQVSYDVDLIKIKFGE